MRHYNRPGEVHPPRQHDAQNTPSREKMGKVAAPFPSGREGARMDGLGRASPAFGRDPRGGALRAVPDEPGNAPWLRAPAALRALLESWSALLAVASAAPNTTLGSVPPTQA